MIKGGLISAKIEFKASNRHEGGRNPSLFFYYTFIISFFFRRMKEYLTSKTILNNYQYTDLLAY